jgi:formylglycine-generating enzyme
MNLLCAGLSSGLADASAGPSTSLPLPEGDNAQRPQLLGAAPITSGRAKNQFLISLCALAVGAGAAAQAAAPAITNVAMVPRLSIVSDVGAADQIEYCTHLGQSNWVVLTNLVVTQSPYLFVDMAAPVSPQRFYRVTLNQPDYAAPGGMALIPAGCFTMGDTLDGDSSALPLHTNYVSAFYMDTNLVSYALWQQVYQWATNHGYTFDYRGSGKAASHPVHDIDWYDCVKWCNARSEKEGRTPAYYTDPALSQRYRTGQAGPYVNWSTGYRLPTEAEWEKAARGGASGHRFPWSNVDTISWSQANYCADPSDYPYDVNPTGGSNPAFNDGVAPYTSPVGYFAANGYGLYDMAGNVWQWCWDWYGPYSSASQSDPRGAASGSSRVDRGGSWGLYALYGRTAARDCSYPTYRDGYLGFRSVLPRSGQP